MRAVDDGRCLCPPTRTHAHDRPGVQAKSRLAFPHVRFEQLDVLQDGARACALPAAEQADARRHPARCARPRPPTPAHLRESWYIPPHGAVR